MQYTMHFLLPFLTFHNQNTFIVKSSFKSFILLGSQYQPSHLLADLQIISNLSVILPLTYYIHKSFEINSITHITLS